MGSHVNKATKFNNPELSGPDELIFTLPKELQKSVSTKVRKFLELNMDEFGLSAASNTTESSEATETSENSEGSENSETTESSETTEGNTEDSESSESSETTEDSESSEDSENSETTETSEDTENDENSKYIKNLLAINPNLDEWGPIIRVLEATYESKIPKP